MHWPCTAGHHRSNTDTTNQFVVVSIWFRLFISLPLIHTCRCECTQTDWQLPLPSMQPISSNVTKKWDIWHRVHQELVKYTPAINHTCPIKVVSNYRIKSVLHPSQHRASQITLTTDTPLSIHQVKCMSGSTGWSLLHSLLFFMMSPGQGGSVESEIFGFNFVHVKNANLLCILPAMGLFWGKLVIQLLNSHNIQLTTTFF